MKESSQRVKQDGILAGVDLTMRYLGCGVLPNSKHCGTDNDIARIIHDIHSMYSHGKNTIKKAREVVVLVDSQRVNIYAKDAPVDDILMKFPLNHVRDVTACVDKGPYSKTCVLVAKEGGNPYKAYVFHTKTEGKAVEFYQTISLAFEVGYKLLEKFHRCSDAVEADLDTSIININSVGLNETGSVLDLGREHFGNCDGFNEDYCEDIKVHAGRTTTIHITANSASLTKRSKECNNDQSKSADLSQSKMALYFEERSRFLLARWFRSSYKKFQQLSGNSLPERHDAEGHGLIAQPSVQ